MLASTTKYGIRALLYLATIPESDLIQIKTLSKNSGVPGPYLAKIMRTLAKAGVVYSRKGMSGGVRLPPRNPPLSFYDVCVALEDPIVESQCMLSKKQCSSTRPCSYHNRWKVLRNSSVELLQSMKIPPQR